MHHVRTGIDTGNNIDRANSSGFKEEGVEGMQKMRESEEGRDIFSFVLPPCLAGYVIWLEKEYVNSYLFGLYILSKAYQYTQLTIIIELVPHFPRRGRILNILTLFHEYNKMTNLLLLKSKIACFSSDDFLKPYCQDCVPDITCEQPLGSVPSRGRQRFSCYIIVSRVEGQSQPYVV